MNPLQKLNCLPVQKAAVKTALICIKRKNMCVVIKVWDMSERVSNKHAVEPHPYPRGENFPIIGFASAEGALMARA